MSTIWYQGWEVDNVLFSGPSSKTISGLRTGNEAAVYMVTFKCLRIIKSRVISPNHRRYLRAELLTHNRF